MPANKKNQKLSCEDCQAKRNSEIFDLEHKYYNWLNVYHFLRFLYTEEQITKETYEEIINDLLKIKPFLDD